MFPFMFVLLASDPLPLEAMEAIGGWLNKVDRPEGHVVLGPEEGWSPL